MRNTVVYMVAVIVNSQNKVVGYKLFNLGLNQCVTVTAEKLISLMERGYEVFNLRLNERGRIETVPRSCGIKRYTWLDESSKIKDINIRNVLLSKHKGKSDREICLLYNNSTGKIELFEYSEALGTNLDHVSNLIDLADDSDNTIYDKLNEYWENISSKYNKVKWKIDKNLNLVDFAVYKNGTFNLNGCLWVENMHHTICDKLVIDGLVYGISYHGIKSCRIKEMVIDVKFMDTESIINSEIETLRLEGKTWFTGRSLIKNCKIKELIIDDNIELNSNILDDTSIENIRIKGKTPKIKKDCKSLLNKCSNLKYVSLDKNIDTELYELICHLVGGDAKILLV